MEKSQEDEKLPLMSKSTTGQAYAYRYLPSTDDLVLFALFYNCGGAAAPSEAGKRRAMQQSRDCALSEEEYMKECR